MESVGTDVWEDLICTQLQGRDLVALSMVCKLGYKVAHACKHHQGFIPVDDTTETCSTLAHIASAWPNLRIKFLLLGRYTHLNPANLAAALPWIGRSSKLTITHTQQITSLKFLQPARVLELAFAHMPLNEECCKDLRDFLSAKNLALEFLCLDRVALAEGVTQYLLEAVSFASNLKRLTLTDTENGEITAVGLEHLIQHTTCLSSLYLSANNLKSEGAKKILQALSTNKTVTDLSISSNPAINTVCQEIENLLTTNSTLTSLALKWSALGGEGGSGVMRCLTHNSSLTALDLSRNAIESVGELGSALVRNSSLLSLSLQGNMIGGEGVRELCAGLKQNTTLRALNLKNNAFVGEEGKWLVEMLLQNSTLTSLEVLRGIDVETSEYSQIILKLHRNKLSMQIPPGAQLKSNTDTTAPAL